MCRQSWHVRIGHYQQSPDVLGGGLTLLQENLEQELGANPTLARVMRDSNASVSHIAAVLRVLQCVTAVKQTTYHGQTRMIDIETALREELARGDARKR